ncbi:unnamed protein product [Paramecium sonneborni]|uniref:Uncharacterized protein n=1 Tax=Paramecium sonneborni TaxID=65129 RepID=A0A8S1PD40_9CILI|nr:unnamed protein product [Paramecium sonneborni]
MQTQNHNDNDRTNFENIENTFKYQDEEKLKNEFDLLTQQLQGARKNLQEKYQKDSQKEQNQATDETYLSKTMEDTGQLNSIDINISYYESKQIEKLLTDLLEKTNYLKQKLIIYTKQENLERQYDLLSDQLSHERLQSPKDLNKINSIKDQLRQLKKKLKENCDKLCADIDKMLKPLQDEFDDDVQVIYASEN